MRQRTTRPLLAALAVAALSNPMARLAASETPEPGTLITVAGTGEAGAAGDGGLATKAQLHDPRRVVVDATGALFIAETDGNRVRRVSPEGIISTVAGTGEPGFSGDGGPAAQAQLNEPNGVTVDANGVLYIADTGNRRVRKVTPDGVINTIAGTGKIGHSGDGGPAIQAQLDTPTGMVVDAAGNLLIANFEFGTVRKISPDGIITTIAGNGRRGIPREGSLATETSLFSPDAVALDAAGNLYIADRQVSQVRKVSVDGTITTVAGTGQDGFSGDGGLAIKAKLNSPHDLAVDLAGNLYIAEIGNERIRKVSPDGIITTVAGGGKPTSGFGEGGPALDAILGPTMAVAVDSHGNLLIANSDFDWLPLGLDDRVVKAIGIAAPGLLAGRPFPKP